MNQTNRETNNVNDRRRREEAERGLGRAERNRRVEEEEKNNW